MKGVRLFLVILLFVGVFFGFTSGAEEIFLSKPTTPLPDGKVIANATIQSGNISKYVTETITCKFNDITSGKLLTEKTNCVNSFHFGNIQIPAVVVQKADGGTYTSQLQYQCDGAGECKIIITGEKGSKFKWTSFCMEHVADAGIKSWDKLISNPNLTTTLDGRNKVVEIECASQSFAGRILAFVESIFRLIFNDVNWGSRGGYALCYDGSEIIINNPIPFCEKIDEMYKDLGQKCKDKCDIDGNNCGFAQAGVSSNCDLDNPNRNIQSEVSSIKSSF